MRCSGDDGFMLINFVESGGQTCRAMAQMLDAELCVSSPKRYAQLWQAEGEGRLMVYDSSYIVVFPQVLWESGWKRGREK